MSEELKKQSGLSGEDVEQPFDETAEVDSEKAGPATGKSDVELLEQELAETRDKLLRLAAEFENFKKRMERERENLLKYAGENILRELLTTVDNLDRALEQGSADSEDTRQQLNAMLEGVGLTQKGLLATLERFGVEAVESVGREFDPNLHEAMTMGSSESVPANHVLQEFVKGYRYKDRLLRPAKVVVSQGQG